MPWTFIGWAIAVAICVWILAAIVSIVGLLLLAAARREERKTPEGRAAQACRDLAEALRKERVP